ncbi:MAG: MBL fold metallo-hydrolase [Pikeienuella sp.]
MSKIKVTFWGTRGSIPTSFTQADMAETLANALNAASPADVATPEAVDAFVASGCNGAVPTRFGGETTCVEFENAGGGRVIIDFGSGVRRFGAAMLGKVGPVSDRPYQFLMSHMHWDHIQGFPFFVPGFIPGNQVKIAGCHPADVIEGAITGQFQPAVFPVPYQVLGADISYTGLDPEEPFEMEGFKITPHLLNHGGGCYGYRFEYDGVSVVYASDAEHKPEQINPDYPYVHWAKGADALIFDAQYSLLESISVKEDWGHSSNIVGVELAHIAGVKKLLLTHHEPLNGDELLSKIVDKSVQYEELHRPKGADKVEVVGAYDGLVVEA